MDIAIIKYNAGNVQSVQYALERLGYNAIVTDDHAAIQSADKVIFPGVGNAYSAMESLKEKNLDEIIKQLTQPVLGICVGMQLLCNHSEENNTTGLGIVDINVKKFMAEAEYKYKTGMENLVYKPGLSINEFNDAALIKGAIRLQVFSSFSKHVRKYFSNPKLIALMEFPVLFLGATPEDTPALYSLMNYAGLKLGTWYPLGGFGKVIDAMVAVAKKNGAAFHYSSTVEKIEIESNK